MKRFAASGPLADYEVGQRVMTREGLPGVITDIHEGPADLTTYWVALENNMGGGEYAEAEIWPAPAQSTAQMQSESGVEHTAADDYPELGTVLSDRLPPQITRSAAKQATSNEARDWNDADREDTEPGETFLDPPYDEDVKEASAVAAHLALYLPPKAEARPQAEADLDPAEQQGFEDGFAHGKEGITRNPANPADTAYMAGYEQGWAEGVQVGRQPANPFGEDDLAAQQVAEITPEPVPLVTSPITASMVDRLAEMERRGAPVAHEGGALMDFLKGHPRPDSTWQGMDSHYSYDWCRFRRNSHCWLPKDLNEEASKQAGYAVWNPVDRGVCTRVTWTAQQRCPTGEPGPHAGAGGFTDATVPWEQGGQHGGVPSGFTRQTARTIDMTPPLPPAWKGPGIYEVDLRRPNTGCVAYMVLAMGMPYPVGWLTWDKTQHTIDGVWVMDDARGQGIAALLLQHAEEVAGYKMVDSGEYTPEGFAWAKRRGMNPTMKTRTTQAEIGRLVGFMNNLLVGGGGLQRLLEAEEGHTAALSAVAAEHHEFTPDPVDPHLCSVCHVWRYAHPGEKPLQMAAARTKQAGITDTVPEVSGVVREYAMTPTGTDFFAGEADDISKAYRDLPVLDPAAVGLWQELGALCRAQAEMLKARYTVIRLDNVDPYSTAAEMYADVDKGIYKVTSLHSNHPVWDVDTNVAFRVVHDLTGHTPSHSDFSFKGEVIAYANQCAQTPEHLWPVLFTEIVAQSAYANTHHLFGEQKVGLIPLTQAEIDAHVGKVMDVPDAAYDALHRSAGIDPATLGVNGVHDDLNAHGMQREAAFEVTATWADVRRKAKRIRSEGGVRVLAVKHGDEIVGHVKGDHGVYETWLRRNPGRDNVAYWHCGCKWGHYSWGRSAPYKRFEGRMCSHALALQYEAQARSMFGRELTLDEKQPAWMDQKHVHRPGDYDRTQRRYTHLEVTSAGKLTLYRGEGSHNQPSLYTQMGKPELAGGWWTSDLDQAKGYASRGGQVYVVDVDEDEVQPGANTPNGRNYFIPDPEVRARRRLYTEGHLSLREVYAAYDPEQDGQDVSPAVQIAASMLSAGAKYKEIRPALLALGVAEPARVVQAARTKNFRGKVDGQIRDLLIDDDGHVHDAHTNEHVDHTQVVYPGWDPTYGLNPNDTKLGSAKVAYDPSQPRDTDGQFKAAAHAMMEMAKRNEPATTAWLKANAQRTGGKMEGLDFRFKSEGSLLRKMRSEAPEFGNDPGRTAANMSDTLRYTTVYPAEHYTEGVKHTLASMQAAGFRTRVKNYWGRGDAYNGINVAAHTPSGHPFELQFHTPQSIDVKESKVHPLYEQWRKDDTPASKKRQLSAQMRDTFDNVHRPPGALGISDLKSQPMPGAVPGYHLRAASLPAKDDGYAYRLLHTVDSGHGVAVLRSDGGSTQVWRDGKWVTENEYGRHFFKGEPRSEPISAEEAASFIGGVKEAKSKDRSVPPSEHGDPRLQDAGVSVSQTKDGKYYVHTHRARGKYRDSVADIPDSEIKFIRSTGTIKTADEDQCPYDASDSLMQNGSYVCEDGHRWHPDDPAAQRYHGDGPERGQIQPLPKEAKMDPLFAARIDDEWGFEVLADLHEEPEPALPSTDGAEEDEEAQRVAQRLAAALGAPVRPQRPASPPESAEERGRRLLAYVDASLAGVPVEGPNPYEHLLAGQADNEIAAAAANHLATKQALKRYDPSERMAIINEGEGGDPASNLDRLDIKGTHYEAIEATRTTAKTEDEDLWMLDGDPNGLE